MAHVAGHPLALDDARRVGARADRARRPVDPGRAVRGTAAAEAVALHHALEAAALGRARHLDPVARFEGLHRHLLAQSRQGIGVDAELTQDRRRGFKARPGGVAELRLGRPVRFFGAEAELHRAVTFLFGGAYLDHRTRAGLDDGHRHHHPVLCEDLGHAQLLSNDS
jgi:hypothetical protein